MTGFYLEACGRIKVIKSLKVVKSVICASEKNGRRSRHKCLINSN